MAARQRLNETEVPRSGRTPRDVPIHDRPVDAAGGKANALFPPAIIVAFTSLGGGPVELVLGLASAGALALAAWTLREGLRAQAAYRARTVARRPRLPRKILSSGLTGLGVALAAGTGDAGLFGSLLYGVAGVALHLAAFGIDPLTDKRAEGVDSLQSDRVARVVDTAEEHLDGMLARIEALRDRRLTGRVVEFQSVARRMIREVEADPRDLAQARKYLGVYLMGAREATEKFADLYARRRDAKARADYEALLTDLEQNFAERTEKMLLDDRSDMDIEIKVLRDRLEREGV